MKKIIISILLTFVISFPVLSQVISALDPIVSTASDDLLYILDVSDTTTAATGSGKSINWELLSDTVYNDINWTALPLPVTFTSGSNSILLAADGTITTGSTENRIAGPNGYIDFNDVASSLSFSADISLENGEKIINSTDDVIRFSGTGGAFDDWIEFDLDEEFTGPAINASSSIAIRQQIIFGDEQFMAFGFGTDFRMRYTDVGFTNNFEMGFTSTPGDLYIYSSEVGIGTSAPDALLHINGSAGYGAFKIDGDTGACLMLRDTDNAGWTECNVLDGTMSCATDADGACDGS